MYKKIILNIYYFYIFIFVINYITMSNQVYSNETRKYIPQRGIILYSNVITSLVGGALPVKLTWGSQIIDDASIVRLESDTFTFTALRDGVYHVDVNLSYFDSANPITNDVQTSTELVISKPAGPLILRNDITRHKPRGGSTGGDSHTTPFSNSFYLDKGEQFFVTMRCDTSTGLTFNYSNISITLL